MTGLQIFLFLTLASITLLAMMVIMLSRFKTRKAAVKFREALLDRGAFIGKDLAYFLDRLGIYAQGGSMDRGQEIYSWRAENIVVEAWFQDGICVSFEEKEYCAS
jgi:hypothetical protein